MPVSTTVYLLGRGASSYLGAVSSAGVPAHFSQFSIFPLRRGARLRWPTMLPSVRLDKGFESPTVRSIAGVAPGQGESFSQGASTGEKTRSLSAVGGPRFTNPMTFSPNSKSAAAPRLSHGDS